MKYLALGIFVLTYSLLLVLPKYRAYIAISSAVLFVILGILPINKVFTSVDWNVILMISGTMGVVYLFIESKMPAKLADLIIQKTPNVKWAIISLALFAGVISAFIDNVATVLMIAPVALNIAKKLKISPVPSIIVIAISSNLQGMATLVGDTTSILLGGYAGLDFLDFFWFNGKIGIFWVVEISALFSVLILLYIFRKNNEPVKVYEKTTVTNYIPTMLLISMIVLLISVSFITNKHAITNGIICMGVFLFGLVGHYIKNKQKNIFLKSLKEIDYFTLLLLTGLFVVIASISEVGIINDISNLFITLSGENLFIVYTLIVWGSVLLSAFIDNIPYVATMLPVVASISSAFGVAPYILYFGLISGATLGGNLTPIGASANITALGILKKAGYEVSTKEFMKIGVPFTFVAVITGYILIWLIWA